MSAVTTPGYTSTAEYDAAHRRTKDSDYEGYNLDRGATLSRIQQNYEQSIALNQRWQVAAARDARMLAGDQMTNMQSGSAFSQSTPGQTTLLFNKILLGHNMLVGYQMNNRLQSTVVSEHPDHQEAADDHSEVLNWAMDKDHTYDKISECFGEALTTGLCLHTVWLDKSTDLDSGEIKTQRLNSNQFIMDPYWENPDLSDCKWIMYRRWMHKSMAANMMPELRDEILSMAPAGGQGDNKFNFMPYQYQYAIRDMVSWDEYWEIVERPQEYIYDKEEDRHLLWKLGEDAAKEHVVDKFPERLSIKKVPTKTVRRTILVNNRPLYAKVSPWGLDRYPFVTYIGYHFPQIVDYSLRYFGCVRPAIDAQNAFSRRMTANLAILESQIDSGIKMKEGALVKAENAFISGPGRILVVAKNANMEDVQTIPPPNASASSMEMAQQLGKEVTDNMGITQEMLGVAESNDISGLLSKLRQGAGLTAVQRFFSNLNRAQKLLAGVFLELIQKNFRGHKVSQILGKAASPEFYSKDFKRYDCRVIESTMTNTQKQLEFIQLLQMQQLTEKKVPAKLLVEVSSLTRKQDLIKAWEEEDEQQAKEKNRIEHIQLMSAQAQIKEMEQRAINYEASARERDSRSLSNIGLAEERIAQAERDRTDAELNNAKVIKELEGMEQEQIIKALTTLHDIEARQRNEQRQDVMNAQTEADIAARRTNAQSDQITTQFNPQGAPDGQI